MGWPCRGRRERGQIKPVADEVDSSNPCDSSLGVNEVGTSGGSRAGPLAPDASCERARCADPPSNDRSEADDVRVDGVGVHLLGPLDRNDRAFKCSDTHCQAGRPIAA